MTLARQLISTTSAIFLVALLGVEAVHLNSAYRHLQDQLESLAQDAATSLGLSLGVLAPDRDLALIETVINPVFDRGHYAEISFKALDGQPLVTKLLDRQHDGDYPHWLAEMFPLTTTSAESLVSAGWHQLGMVVVRAHPRYAYEQLWASARNTALSMLAIYALGLFALRGFLRGVLRPLTAVEQAAEAIAKRDFVVIGMRPRTRELARVIETMNAMSLRVREEITIETARADNLQRSAYRDVVTGLLNRDGIGAHFDNVHGPRHEVFAGGFALIEVADLARINHALGRHQCDALLHSIGHAVEDITRPGNGFAARYGGAVFAALLPGLSGEALKTSLGDLHARAALVIAEAGLDECPVRIVAVTAADLQVDFATLASAAEDLLHLGRSGEAAIEISALGVDRMTFGATVSAVTEALRTGQVQLVGQAALSLPARLPLHTEVMARIVDADGHLMAAADFIAVVSQQGLISKLDELVVERACAAAKHIAGGETIAINLSVRSLEDSDFIEWLMTRVSAAQPLGALVFEISEYGVVQNQAVVARLATALAPYGVGFAIDRFGVHPRSLALMQELKPAYLKLSHLHTRNLLGDAGTRFYVEAVVRAARQLGIPVIAQNVEDEAVLAILSELGVAGYQGYISGRPAPWPA